MRMIYLALAAGLAGCSGISRNDPPEQIFMSKLKPADMTACLVRDLDARSIDRTGLGKTLTHEIRITALGSVYEVHPSQPVIVGAEVYFLKVSADQSGSRVEAFGAYGFQNKAINAAKSCA